MNETCAGEAVSDAERDAARRIAAGVEMDDVNGLIDELGAVVVARGLLMLRDLIQRLTHPRARVEKVPELVPHDDGPIPRPIAISR